MVWVAFGLASLHNSVFMCCYLMAEELNHVSSRWHPHRIKSYPSQGSNLKEEKVWNLKRIFWQHWCLSSASLSHMVKSLPHHCTWISHRASPGGSQNVILFYITEINMLISSVTDFWLICFSTIFNHFQPIFNLLFPDNFDYILNFLVSVVVLQKKHSCCCTFILLIK